jgi:hypothetical protein
MPKLRLIRNPIEEELLLAVRFPKADVEKEKPELRCRISEEKRKPELKLLKS